MNTETTHAPEQMKRDFEESQKAASIYNDLGRSSQLVPLLTLMQEMAQTLDEIVEISMQGGGDYELVARNVLKKWNGDVVTARLKNGSTIDFQMSDEDPLRGES